MKTTNVMPDEGQFVAVWYNEGGEAHCGTYNFDEETGVLMLDMGDDSPNHMPADPIPEGATYYLAEPCDDAESLEGNAEALAKIPATGAFVCIWQYGGLPWVSRFEWDDEGKVISMLRYDEWHSKPRSYLERGGYAMGRGGSCAEFIHDKD